MSFLEQVKYNNLTFEESPIILCRLQKFMYIYLTSCQHPLWFQDALRDIYGNSFLPVPKVFFYEEEIEGKEDRKKYVVEMLNRCIAKLMAFEKQQFLDYISTEIKGTFFDITPVEDLTDNAGYKKYYINTLVKLKKIIRGNEK